MNPTKKTYKSNERGLGGAIGTGLGAIAGGMLGNPMLGAKLGGMAGGLVEGQVKKHEGPQAPNIPYASTSMGYAQGGYLGNVGKVDFPSVDAGGRRKSKTKAPNISYKPESQFKPIGQDATKVEGESHEQGGVDLPTGEEVEGDETIDNVSGQDYVFSKRLKVPGSYESFAEVHEQMVKNNASPEAIERLAQMQERVSGRS